MQRDDLRHYLDELLEVARTRDYCPNGLQVEGRAEIRRLVCGVSASQSLIEQAVAREADAVIVHHGYFWKGEDPVSPEFGGGGWQRFSPPTSTCSRFTFRSTFTRNSAITPSSRR